MPDAIRVFHLIKSLGRGGAEMLLPEALRFSDREAFDYSYGYFLPWKDAMVSALRDQGAEVTCFDQRGNVGILLSARRLARHLQRNRIDLIHCHLPVAGAVGRIAGKLANVPVVYTEHNKQERYHPITRALNVRTWGSQARVVAVSDDVADSIARHIGSAVPVEVVLNGVDVGLFDRVTVDGDSVRRRFDIDSSAPVIGTVAVFRTQKKLGDWVAAAKAISTQRPDARFLVVGDGPTREEVEAAVREHGLGSVLFLPGLQEDVKPFLAAMDVYMMSSEFEGLPVALLEAMSMGCVPVCTAVGGIPEVIRSGENGLLTTPGRPEELAAAVGSLLSASGHCTELGARARQTVVERFSMARMARQLEDLYRNVLGLNTARTAGLLADSPSPLD